MKKLLLMLCIIFFSSATIFANLNVKAGVDLFGNTSTSLEDTVGTIYSLGHTKQGFSISAEYFIDILKNLETGIGVSYLFKRLSEGTNNGTTKDSFIPIYITAKYTLFRSSLFIRGNFGYSIIDSEGANPGGRSIDYDNGLYYGFGLGYEFENNFFIECMFEYFNYSTSLGLDIKYTYAKSGLNIGYKFNI